MILNSYIHEQLAEAHRRDLLETAERHRLAGQAARRSGIWSLRSVLRKWGPRRQTGGEPCLSTSSPSTATR